MWIDMKVARLAVDTSTQMPFVVLADVDGKRSLSIWIGVFEASAIAAQLESLRPARPMTHDLLASVVKGLGKELVCVEIHDLKDSTYFASLVLRGEATSEVRVDARPSDAIALALRLGSSIRVEAEVLRKSTERAHPRPSAPPSKDEKEKWAEMLKNLSPEAFGKYKQ